MIRYFLIWVLFTLLGVLIVKTVTPVIYQPPAFPDFSVQLPDSGCNRDETSCSSSWPIGSSQFQKPGLVVVLFLHFISCFLKCHEYVVSVFKNRGAEDKVSAYVFALLFILFLCFTRIVLMIYNRLSWPVNHPCQMLLLGSQEKGWPLGCLSRVLLGPCVLTFCLLWTQTWLKRQEKEICLLLCTNHFYFLFYFNLKS